MLRSTVLGALLACLGTISVSHSATPDHLEALPADTWLVIQLEDVHDLAERWQEHSLNELWLHPRLQAFIAPGLEEEGESLDELLIEGLGIDSEALLGLTDGSITFALSEIIVFDEDFEELDVERAALIWETVDETQDFDLMRESNLETLTEEWEGFEVEELEDEFDGVTFWIHEIYDPDSQLSWEDSVWAEFDGLAVLSMSSGYLEEFIGNLRNDEHDGPSFDEQHLDAALEAVAGAGDGFIYVDIRPWVSFIRSEALNADEHDSETIEKTKSLFAAMNLETLESLAMSFELGAEDTRFDLALMHRKPSGLLDLLAFAPGPLVMPDFAPLDVASVSALRFDPHKIWQEIALLAEAIQPGSLAMAGGMIKGAGQGLGIELDLERDLLGSLGKDLVTLARPSPVKEADDEVDWAAQQQLIGLAIEDRQAIERVLSAFEVLGTQGQDLIERRDYLGHTISSIPDAATAWTITDEWILASFAGTDLLEASLRRLADHGGASVWDRKDLKAALGRLPESPRVFGYQSGESTIGVMLDAFVALDAVAIEEDEGRLIDPQARPDPKALGEILGPVVSVIYQSEQSTILQWHAFHALDDD